MGEPGLEKDREWGPERMMETAGERVRERAREREKGKDKGTVNETERGGMMGQRIETFVVVIGKGWLG